MPAWLAWVLHAPQILMLVLLIGGAVVVLPIVLRDEMRLARGGPIHLRGKNASEAEERAARKRKRRGS